MSFFKRKCHKDCWCGKDLGDRFRHYLPVLQTLVNAKPAQRAIILKKGDSCLVRLLCEFALNVLKGNVKLPEGHYKKLKPHKRLLLQVTKPSASLAQRRLALVTKKGGFLPVLLPPLLTALATFALDKVLG